MTVSALRWTSSGAVATPETLQVRLEPRFPGRVAAGAPLPSRPLTDDEVLDNVRWFADPGPRGRPVRTLVISGITPERVDTLEALASSARRDGIERVVVHLPSQLVRNLEGVDEVTVSVRTPAEAATTGGRAVVVPLEVAVLGDLLPLLLALTGAGCGRVTLLWPLPGPSVEPPPAARAIVAALRGAADALQGLNWGLKGLPTCTLLDLRTSVPDIAGRAWRSANRWYVDADHQREAGLLFRPDVVRFEKRDSCRFCAVEGRCDGVPADWLALGLAGALVPAREEP